MWVVLPVIAKLLDAIQCIPLAGAYTRVFLLADGVDFLVLFGKQHLVFFSHFSYRFFAPGFPLLSVGDSIV